MLMYNMQIELQIKLAVIVGTWQKQALMVVGIYSQTLKESSFNTFLTSDSYIKQVLCLYAIWKIKFAACERAHYELNMLYNRWRVLK